MSDTKYTPLPKAHYYYSPVSDGEEGVLADIAAGAVVSPCPQKIVLIVPPSPQVPTPGREFLVTGPFEGFTAVATLVKKLGFDLTVLDCRLKEDPVSYALERIGGADLIGIATYCDSFVFLQDVTRRVKERYPHALVVLGGPLVTSIPDTILVNTAADCAVVGEGELTLMELFKKYFEEGKASFTAIKGLAWKEDGHVRINPPRPQIKNLDNLPFLDYTIWPNYEDIVKNGQILISSMRGCPQECTFCFKTIPALRLKSLERFEREVAFLKETTRFDYTWLNDLTFNVIEGRAVKISDIMKKYDIHYHCFARVQKVTRPFVEKLKETGCLGIWFGFESYEQGILNLNRKNIKVEEIENAARLAAEAGLGVRGLFIVGLCGETETSLKKMVAFIRNSKFLPLVKYLVPFPGTSIYHHALQTGKIKDVVSFLRMLSERKVRDYDDAIINLTDLSEETLRHYFHQIWEITKERESQYAERR